MKNRISLAILLAFIWSSCQRGNEPAIPQEIVKSTSIYDYLMANNKKTDGNIVINATSLAFSDLPATQFDITGFCRDKNGNPAPLQMLNVGGFDIPEQNNLRYDRHFGSKPMGRDSFVAALNKCFGGDVNVKLESQTFGNLDKVVYCPNAIKVDLSAIKNDVISKKEGITIKFTPNRSGSTRTEEGEKLAAGIVYQAGIVSNRENKVQYGLPSENESVFKLVDESAGSVTFTPAELAKLPLNGYVVIFMARANQTIVQTSTGLSLTITGFALNTSQDYQLQQ
ncbi:MAG: hypothetical protein RL757_2369 [Bacteroidota bacterium]|jgi:hypothetical protein